MYFNAGRPAWVDMQMANRLKIPHTFVMHTYTKPTKCHFCNKVKQISSIEWQSLVCAVGPGGRVQAGAAMQRLSV